MTTSASPRAVLAALTAHISPAPLLSKLPIALQLFAHLQLLSARLKAEAARALQEQEILAEELSRAGVPQYEWVANGALGKREGRKIGRWANRDAEDHMFAFTLEIRKYHIAKVLCAPKITPERARPLIDTYFPSRADVDAVEDVGRIDLYIRIMSEEQWSIHDIFRKTVMGWHNEFRRNHRAGRNGPRLEDLVGSSGSDALEVVARNLLRESESIVQDAEDFLRIFGVQQEGDEVTRSDGSSKGNGPPALSDQAPALAAAVSRAHVPTPRLSLPSLSSSSVTVDGVDRNRRRTTGHIAGPSNHRTSDDMGLRDATAHGPPRKDPPADLSPRPKPVPRKSMLTPAEGPDYTKPVSRIGDRVPKEAMRPFDQRILKRPRSSLDARRRAQARTAGSGAAPREALGNGESLGNSQSQSSEESQSTKEQRRLKKGKFRAEEAVSRQRVR